MHLKEGKKERNIKKPEGEKQSRGNPRNVMTKDNLVPGTAKILGNTQKFELVTCWKLLFQIIIVTVSVRIEHRKSSHAHIIQRG